MDRPHDIPEDVWNVSDGVLMESPIYNIATDYYEATQELIARAILAERENCAQIADAHSECERDCGDEIAAAIRAGSASTHHEIRDLGEFVAERNGKE